MSAYLLLRNNKESGPYTLNDLVGMGLKPYDLIWVQGKSAAWRYPCELEELKSFAPQVEEQPFDRFYKKPSEVKKTEPAPVLTSKSSEKNGAGTIEEKYQKYIPKGSVAITLPGQKAVAVQRPVSPKPIPEPAPTISVTENPVAAEVKYSQPLDDIKEMYVKTLQERKDKIARKSFAVKNIKKAAVITGILAIGVLAGFIIKPGQGKNSGELSQSSSSITHELAEQQPKEPAAEENSSQQTILSAEEVQKLRSEIIEKKVEPKKEKPQPSQEEIRKETTMLVENQKNKKNTTAFTNKKNNEADATSGIETSMLNGERNRKVRDDNPLSDGFTNSDNNEGNDNDETRVIKNKKTNPLLSFVSVTSNNYTKVAFGGIRNLELTVSNDSKFTLDKVIVELQYLKPSEQPLRTEMIQFRSIAPNEAVTKRIQDTNRGIKVTCKIVDIESVQQETASSGF